MDRLTAPPARRAALVPATAARRVSRWAWLIVLVVGLTLFELIRWAVQNTGNLNLVPTLLLLGEVVVPLAFATFLLKILDPGTFVRDRPDRASPRKTKKSGDFPARKPGEPSVTNVIRKIEFHLLSPHMIT